MYQHVYNKLVGGIPTSTQPLPAASKGTAPPSTSAQAQPTDWMASRADADKAYCVTTDDAACAHEAEETAPERVCLRGMSAATSEAEAEALIWGKGRPG